MDSKDDINVVAQLSRDIASTKKRIEALQRDAKTRDAAMLELLECVADITEWFNANAAEISQMTMESRFAAERIMQRLHTLSGKVINATS